MEIIKEDFEIIYEIEGLSINSIKSLIGRIADNEEEVRRKLDRLENEGLIESDRHEIYSLTEKGNEIYNDDKYKKWLEEIEFE